MNLRFSGAVALLFASAAAPAQQSAKAEAAAQACALHVYPAEGIHTVGDDFDSNHRVDQDLRHYYETAGRPLNWLSTARQLELLREMQLGASIGVTEAAETLYAAPLTRLEALKAGPRVASAGCMIEILVPQIFLERGALAARSLRVFGVVRRYEAGTQVRTYSGYAAAPMPGFQMRSAADADDDTAIIEAAYRRAVETMLRNSNQTKHN